MSGGFILRSFLQVSQTSCLHRFAFNARLSTTPVKYHIGHWRKAKGLSFQHTDVGVMTNRPDYTFVDGRAVPLGMNLQRRLAKQKEYAERIVKLNNEIDFAIERHALMTREKEETEQGILQSKLKAKGGTLKKKKHVESEESS